MKSPEPGSKSGTPWPDARVTGASYERVETEVTCVLTRFRLRSPFGLLSRYRAFRRASERADPQPPSSLRG